MNHAQAVALAAGIAGVAVVLAAAGLKSVSYRWPGVYRAAASRALGWLRSCARRARRVPRPHQFACRAHEKAFPSRGRHHASRAPQAPETTGARQ